MEAKGWLEVLAGPMYCGKTEELLRRLRRVQLAKKPFLLVKPALDTRYSSTEVVSHSGYRMDAHCIRTGSNPEELDAIMGLWRERGCPKVVGIDEAQFFNALHLPVEQLVDRGVQVILAGLDLDYRGYPFLDATFFALADEVTKLSAVCMTCGRPATRTQRISGGDALVKVGGQGDYEARCRTHWTGEATG